MRRLLLFLLCLPSFAFAANWYVRPNAAGSSTGADWNNAWTIANLNAHWSSVAAGDTVWLAGGTYPTAIEFTKSGTASSPITVNRVRTTDAAPTAAPGWNASFDAQVVISPSGGNPLDWETAAGNYVVLDGRILQGITAVGLNNTSVYGSAVCIVGASAGGGNNNITIRNVDMYCSLNAQTTNWVGNMAACLLIGANNINLTNCLVHGGPQAIKLDFGCTNCTFQGCKIYDSFGSSAFHPNLIECNGSQGPFVFNGCEFTQWEIEGFEMSNGFGKLTVENSIIHDPYTGGSASLFWCSGTGESTAGPILFYNNTVANVNLTNGQGNSTNPASGSQSRNNIYFNSGWNGNPISDEDYIYSSGSATGSHSIANGANPFVSSTAKTTAGYNVNSGSGTIGKGSNLGTTFNVSFLGGSRPSTGSWDIGAYQSGSSPTPTPTPTATPTPTPTATPTPTITPTPTPTPSPTPEFVIGQQIVTSLVENIRSTAAGTLLGTQPTGAIGTVIGGPQAAVLNGTSFTWWQITFNSGVNGWVGSNGLSLYTPSPTPIPTPSPTATPSPAPTYLQWEAQLNAAVASGQAIGPWIAANPPVADVSQAEKPVKHRHHGDKPKKEGEMQKIGRTLDKVL